jgi:DNA polymerase III alpha subunit
LNNVKLKDRTLWFDGDSSYPADTIIKRSGTVTSVRYDFVDNINDEIKRYNNLVPLGEQIQIKESIRPLKFDWIIPDEYKTLNVRSYVIKKLEILVEESTFTDREISDRAVRVSKELKLFETNGLNNVLRVLIFIINTLNNQSVVWGVGRGSSVSSYVLYLLEIHDVDSVKYQLDIADFLH